MSTPLVRSADAHLQAALVLVDSSFSLDRGVPEGAVNRELLGFHLEAARREIRHLTDRPTPGHAVAPVRESPEGAGSHPAHALGAGAEPPLAGGKEPTPGSASAFSGALSESPGSRGGGPGQAQTLHDPEQPRPKPKPGAARHMPGTAALAKAINESLARRQ